MGKLLNQGRRVSEIEDPGAAGRQRDEQPDGVLQDTLEYLLGVPSLSGEPDATAAIALDEIFNPNEEIRPNGLGTRIAAPQSTE